MPRTHAYAAALFTLTSGLALPAAAAAAPFNSIAFELGEDTAIVTLGGEARPGRPQVRTDEGMVRIWFPNGRGSAIWELEGDGRAVRSLELRPGVRGTSLIILRLADDRVLRPDDVMVLRSPLGATVHIPRDVLPNVPPPAPETERASAPAPTERPAAAEAPETDEASTLADARVADAANDDDAANAPVAALASHRPFPSRPESDDAEATPPVLASASEGTELPYGLLLAITAILGGLHLLMKALAKRGRIPMPEASIDVVASKRLGTRHQLVVVRALGEEHLLSVNGGQLQHLSTAATGAGLSESLADGSAFQALNAVAAPAAPSSVPPPPDANPEPPAFLANVAARLRQGAALAPTGVLPRPQLPEAQSFAVPQPRLGLENVGENVKEDEGADRFGAQLLRLAELREDNAQLGLSEHRPPSAAVAGLLRLRAKAQRG